MDKGFETAVQQMLEALRNGRVVRFDLNEGKVMACDADNQQAVDELRLQNPGAAIRLMLSDVRELLRYVAAPAPDAFDVLEETGVPVYFENIIGVAEGIADEKGGAEIILAKDELARHVIKRLRKAVAVIN